METQFHKLDELKVCDQVTRFGISDRILHTQLTVISARTKYPATTTPWAARFNAQNVQNTKQDFQNPHPTFQSSREFQG